MGSQVVGKIALETLYARGDKILGVFAYDNIVGRLANYYGIQKWDSIKDAYCPYGEADLIVSCHGKEIVDEVILDLTRLGGINIHPCLFKYKGMGVRPITQLLKDKGTMASIGIHWMTARPDEGPVILEKMIDVTGATTTDAVYNRLYPHYPILLMEAMDKLEG